MKSNASKMDIHLTGCFFPVNDPAALPLSFLYGGQPVRGIPAEFQPEVKTDSPKENVIRYVIEGRNADGLTLRMECLLYRDYPVVEYLGFITNDGEADTPVISGLKVFDAVLPLADAALRHGNGDTCRDDGYEWTVETVDHAISLTTFDGTSCNGAFPYMRLLGEGCGMNIAVGWPAMWQADFAPDGDGTRVTIGQRRCATVLHPGETLRTPRATFMLYTGDEDYAANLWRRWYLTCILPHPHGEPLPPKCCMHVFQAEGKPEFTGASEANQVGGIEDYLRNGVRPDLWWIDAGWYPCDYDWTAVGTWEPDAARFPNGLAPIGRKCAENNMDFLLWFEPERVRPGTLLDKEHPEWLLYRRDENGSVDRNRLLNLGNPACCDWLIEHIDALIKASGVTVYRQDFNFPPAPYWEQNEARDRVGAPENFHVQGYLRYWDELLARNPGLWIDSCASGGRRNDLETMRRAVPLHYTDVGYGNHPIKQKQHHQMFAWIPYFRAHNMTWDDPATGEYDGVNRPAGRYDYHCAMTPSLTDMLAHDASEEAFALAREMQAIWRRAAEMMLSCDYYPLTACRKSAEDFYAVQFHDPDAQRGYAQVIRNNRCPEESFLLKPKQLQPGSVYLLTDPETGEALECTGAELAAGIDVSLPSRSGRIYFYEKVR